MFAFFLIVKIANINNEFFEDVTVEANLLRTGYPSSAIASDLNNDGNLDIFVCHDIAPSCYYLNDGAGGLTFYQSTVTPGAMSIATSTGNYATLFTDFDNDGDIDLFIGIRLKPGSIGVPQNGYILENNGKGEYKDVTLELAPEMIGLGMITDAKWADFDNDDDYDLIIVGEWMGIKLFENDNSKFYELMHVYVQAQTYSIDMVCKSFCHPPLLKLGAFLR